MATIDADLCIPVASQAGAPRDREIRDERVHAHLGLAHQLARRFSNRGETHDDLVQVASLALVRAAERFDPDRGVMFSTFAAASIIGELKRHFRDKRWQVHVKRSVKELVLQARDATWQLTQELGRTPAESDIARHLAVSENELRHARQAELAFQPSSLDAPLADQPAGTATLADLLGQPDLRIEHMLDMNAVAAHWGELPLRERKILLMDFYGSLPQTEIGRRLGISQMHVSRLRARALDYLRTRLLDLEERQAS